MSKNIPLFRQCTSCTVVYPNTKEFFKQKNLLCQKCLRVKAKGVRDSRIQKGLCGVCGEYPLVATRSACVKCLAIQQIRTKAQRVKAKAANLCVTCLVRPLVSKALCKVCLEKAANRNRKTTIANALNRQCADCKGPRDSKKQRCENCSRTRRRQSKARSYTLRLRVLDAFGRICNCCGESEKRFLTLDHVNNNGFEERGKRKTHEIYNRSLLPEHREEYQLLCWNCNMGKAHNGGICPHVDGRAEYLKLCL